MKLKNRYKHHIYSKKNKKKYYKNLIVSNLFLSMDIVDNGKRLIINQKANVFLKLIIALLTPLSIFLIPLIIIIYGLKSLLEFKNLMDYLNFKKIYKYNTERFIYEIYVKEENVEEYKKIFKIG
jgi:hypothetical protein